MRAPLPCPSCGGAPFLWISPVLGRGPSGAPTPRRLELPGPMAIALSLELFVCRGCGLGQWRAFFDDPAARLEVSVALPADSPVIEIHPCLRCGDVPHLVGRANETRVDLFGGVAHRACRNCGAVRWFGDERWRHETDEQPRVKIRPLRSDEPLPCGCPLGEPEPLHLREPAERGLGRRAAAVLKRPRGPGWIGRFEAVLCRRCDELFWYVPEPGALAGEHGVQAIDASAPPTHTGPYR